MNQSIRFVVESLPDRVAVERLWRGLDRDGTHSFFLSWTWIGTLLRLMTKRPFLLKAMAGDELIGAALLSPAEARLRGLLRVHQAWFNASGDERLDAVMIEHNGFAGGDRALWPDFLRWFEKQGFADELVVPGIDPPEALEGRLMVLDKLSHGYSTPLKSLGPGGVASAISANARQQLRRSLRDYGETAVLDRAGDVPAALAYFEGLKTLHIRSWTRRGRPHAFASPLFEKFHRALIAAGTDDGSVDLLRVQAHGRVIGYLYNFRRNGVVSSYQSGFDDEDPNLRPGYVCHALAIGHYARAGDSTYDFLAGTNRLKQSFGLERYELVWRCYRKPTLGFMAEHAARRVAHLAKKMARSREI